MLAMVKKKFGSKGLSDAYVPSSKTVPSTGEHLCGCPCVVCVDLERELSPADLDTRLKRMETIFKLPKSLMFLSTYVT